MNSMGDDVSMYPLSISSSNEVKTASSLHSDSADTSLGSHSHLLSSRECSVYRCPALFLAYQPVLVAVDEASIYPLGSIAVLLLLLLSARTDCEIVSHWSYFALNQWEMISSEGWISFKLDSLYWWARIPQCEAVWIVVWYLKGLEQLPSFSTFNEATEAGGDISQCVWAFFLTSLGSCWWGFLNSWESSWRFPSFPRYCWEKDVTGQGIQEELGCSSGTQFEFD